MNRFASSIAWSKLAWCLSVLAVTWATAAWAADGLEPSRLDIRLKATCNCHQSIIRLGDIAEIQVDDPAESRRLAAIELFPAPRKGQTRRVAVREVQDLLQLHAVNLLKCHFHGSSVVRVRASAGTVAPAPRKKTKQASCRRSQPQVRDAHRPIMLVKAVRPVRRGEVLQPSDVEIAAAPPNVQLAGYAVSLKDVVGRQTTRSLTAGQPIARRAIRAPLLVRRGDVVTVLARAASVRVRTTARAMSDGSYGQLIIVQTLTGRDRYSARVVDVQEVEVYPRAVAVPATPDKPTRSVR